MRAPCRLTAGSVRLTLAATGLFVAASCTTGDVTLDGPPEGPVDLRMEAPPPPAAGKGIQLRQPDHVVEPGQEQQWCWVPDWTPDEDVLVKKFLGLQAEGFGHHILLARSLIPRTPGDEFDCTALEAMTGIDPVSVPDNVPGTHEIEPSLRLFPVDHAMRVTAGSSLVVQSHYINYTDEPMLVSDVVHLEFVDEDERDSFTEAGYFVVNHGYIDVPMGDDQTTHIACEVDDSYELTGLIGHMHDWGTAIKIELERDGVLSTVYDVPEWTVEFRDLPPINQYFAAGESLSLQAGDRIHVTCTYDNDTGGPLRFPKEMCVAFSAYAPAKPEPFVVCDDVTVD